MVWSVYILSCSDDTFYVGYSNNVEKRLEVHNSGKGAKYTRSRRPCSLVYSEPFASKSEAMQREWQLKQLSRAGKQALVEGKRTEPSRD